MNDLELARAKATFANHELLVQLSAAQKKVDAGNERIAGIVAELRKASVPWGVIGGRLGITKQAAQQRFGR